MKVINLGSINIDHVYEVDHFVRPGETLSGLSYNIFAGGKGFNQSIALARAGVATRHVGRVGRDAVWLVQRLQAEGIDTSHIRVDDTATGHAIIQVVPSGENAIVLFGGANQNVTSGDLGAAFADCSPGDYLLVQNETNGVSEAIREAHARGMRIVMNPAPMNERVHGYPLEYVSLFILNETEAGGLTGGTDPHAVCARMRQRYPQCATVLTLGRKGAIYCDADVTHHEDGLVVNAVDTTAAGDTFIGYFLAEFLESGDPTQALAQACHAAAICVTREGASASIPLRDEVIATRQPCPGCRPDHPGQPGIAAATPTVTNSPRQARGPVGSSKPKNLIEPPPI